MSGAAVEIDPAALNEPETFRRLVAEPCRPVVLRGAGRDGPLAPIAAIGGARLGVSLVRVACGRRLYRRVC